METKTFKNGFENWYETFFQINSYILSEMDKPDANSHIELIVDMHGTGGLMELAYVWTEEFEEINCGREWDGDFFDAIDEFCHSKNYGAKY